MKRAELDQMSIDELWSLHVDISQLLRQRIQQEKLQLEERLKLLKTTVMSGRRPYPPVLPKYCNPDQPSENLDRSWQVAALAGCTVEIGKANRGFQNPGSEQEANQRPPAEFSRQRA